MQQFEDAQARMAGQERIQGNYERQHHGEILGYWMEQINDHSLSDEALVEHLRSQLAQMTQKQVEGAILYCNCRVMESSLPATREYLIRTTIIPMLEQELLHPTDTQMSLF